MNIFQIIIKRKELFFLLFILSLYVNSVEVGIIYPKGIQQYQKIIHQFKISLPKNISIKEFQIEPKSDSVVANKITDEKIDYLFLMGYQSVKLALETDIPGIFTFVLNPQKYQLIDHNEKPLKNLSGIYTHVSPKKNLDFIKSIISENHRGCLLYNPGISSFIVDEYHKWSISSMNEHKIMDKNDILNSLNSIKNKNNYIIAIPDFKVYRQDTLRIILRYSVLNKIPFFGFSKMQLKAGAIACASINYEGIGEQAALMVMELMNGKNVKDMSMQYAKKIDFVVNKDLLKIFNLE